MVHELIVFLLRKKLLAAVKLVIVPRSANSVSFLEIQINENLTIAVPIINRSTFRCLLGLNIVINPRIAYWVVPPAFVSLLLSCEKIRAAVKRILLQVYTIRPLFLKIYIHVHISLLIPIIKLVTTRCLTLILHPLTRNLVQVPRRPFSTLRLLKKVRVLTQKLSRTLVSPVIIAVQIIVIKTVSLLQWVVPINKQVPILIVNIKIYTQRWQMLLLVKNHPTSLFLVEIKTRNCIRKKVIRTTIPFLTILILTFCYLLSRVYKSPPFSDIVPKISYTTFWIVFIRRIN